MSIIKPILDKKYGETGLYVDEGVIKYNGYPLITSTESKKYDVINFTPYPMSEENIRYWLKLCGFKDVLNSIRILTDNDLNLISSGSIDGIYYFSDKSGNKSLIGNGPKMMEIRDKFDSMIGRFSQVNSDLDDLITKYDLNNELPINLVKKGNISDHVSFSSIVHKVGEDIVNLETTSMTLDGRNMYLRRLVGNEFQRIELRFLNNIKIDLVEPTVRPGDLIDLTINYKQEDEKYTTFNIIYPSVNITSPIRVDGVQIGLRYSEPLDSIRLDGLPILFDGYQATIGNFPEYVTNIKFIIPDDFKSKSSLVLNKFLVEFSEDRVVVYSVDPLVQEYYIKRCRIISRGL